MSKAIVDPEKLREFASALHRFTDDLEKRRSGVRRKFDRLGDTWRDQKHREFAEVFEETMRNLDRFVERAQEQVPHLRKKAEEIERYLDRR